MSEVVDRPARVRALDVDTSFIVQAPAGSGKTELLTQRCLGLLATVDRPAAQRAATACLEWALARYWQDEEDPYEALNRRRLQRVLEKMRGEDVPDEWARAAEVAAREGAAFVRDANPDPLAAYAAFDRALRALCDVVRAAVECPPAEAWLNSEAQDGTIDS